MAGGKIDDTAHTASHLSMWTGEWVRIGQKLETLERELSLRGVSSSISPPIVGTLDSLEMARIKEKIIALHMERDRIQSELSILGTTMH